MALEALADVLSNLGQRYQNKIEDENKRQEHLADVADERAWLEGRTQNEQNFQDSQRQKHVTDEKDVRKYSSDLSLVEQKERIKSEIEGHIQEVNALAPLERAKKLYNDGIVNSIDEGKSISAEAATQAYLSKAAQAETAELTNKLKNLPTEFLITDARNAPVRKAFEESRVAVEKQRDETNRQITAAQTMSDESNVLENLADERMAKFQITPDVVKKLKKNNLTIGQFKSKPTTDQIELLESAGMNVLPVGTLSSMQTSAKNIAKANQANAATLSRALPGYEESIRQLNFHIGDRAQLTPPPPPAQAAPIVGAQALDTTGYFGPPTPPVLDSLRGKVPIADSSFAMPTSAMPPPAVPAQSPDMSMYFNPGAAPAVTPPPVAPAPVVNSIAPVPPPAPVAPPVSSVQNNIVPPPITPDFVPRARPSFSPVTSSGVSTLADLQSQLQYLNTLNPATTGYDLNARKAQLQNQIDSFQKPAAPSYFQMNSIKGSMHGAPIYDATNNVTPGYS